MSKLEQIVLDNGITMSMYSIYFFVILFFQSMYAGQTVSADSGKKDTDTFSEDWSEVSDSESSDQTAASSSGGSSSSSCLTDCSKDLPPYPSLEKFLEEHGKLHTHDRLKAIKQIFYLNSSQTAIKDNVRFVLSFFPSDQKEKKGFQEFAAFVSMIDNPPAFPTFLYAQLRQKYNKILNAIDGEKVIFEKTSFDSDLERQHAEKQLSSLQGQKATLFSLLEDLKTIKSAQKIMNDKYTLYELYKTEMQREQRKHQLKQVQNYRSQVKHRALSINQPHNNIQHVQDYYYFIFLYYLYYFDTISLAYYYYLYY